MHLWGAQGKIDRFGCILALVEQKAPRSCHCLGIVVAFEAQAKLVIYRPTINGLGCRQRTTRSF